MEELLFEYFSCSEQGQTVYGKTGADFYNFLLKETYATSTHISLTKASPRTLLDHSGVGKYHPFIGRGTKMGFEKTMLLTMPPEKNKPLKG